MRRGACTPWSTDHRALLFGCSDAEPLEQTSMHLKYVAALAPNCKSTSDRSLIGAKKMSTYSADNRPQVSYTMGSLIPCTAPDRSHTHHPHCQGHCCQGSNAIGRLCSSAGFLSLSGGGWVWGNSEATSLFGGVYVCTDWHVLGRSTYRDRK